MRTILQSVYGASESHRFSPMKNVFSDDMESYVLHRKRMIEACAENPGLRLVYGHLFGGLGHVVTRPVRLITMLREPIARVLSNYYYRRQHGHCVQQSISLEDYATGNCPVAAMRFEADNLQTRILASLGGDLNCPPFGACNCQMLEIAKRHLAEMSAFGLLDQFDRSLAHFARSQGWTSVPSYAIERATQPYPPKSRTPEAILEKIAENNQWDLQLYHWAGQRFAEVVGEVWLPALSAGRTDQAVVGEKILVHGPGV
jgi:hypothetical protein